MFTCPIVLDNVLPQSFSDEIESALLCKSFPWYFLSDVTSGTSCDFEDSTQGFCHYFYDQYSVLSPYFELVSSIPRNALDKATVSADYEIIQARSFLQLAPAIRRISDTPHIDRTTKHWVCLYYVNDSTGNTVIYSDQGETKAQEIEPKKNRAVLFDGSIWHSSTSPVRGHRCVINFNLLTEE